MIRRRRHHARAARDVRARGEWDGDTLAARVATSGPRNDPAMSRSSTSAGSLHVRPARSATRPRRRRFLAERGVGPAPSCRCSSRTATRRSSLAVAVQSLGAVINPLLPNYRAQRAGARLRDGRDPAWSSRPARTATSTTASSSSRSRGATGRRSAPRRRRRRPWRRRSRSSATCSTAPTGRRSATGRRRRGVGADLHLGHRGDAQGDHAHRADRRTSACASRTRTSASTADDVVWMPSPVGHSTGFNYGLRFALYHGLPLVLQDRWDPAASASTSSRASGASYTLAATTFLQDLVELQPSARGVRLDTLRCFGCGGAPVPPTLVDAAEPRGIGVLRLYGSTEVLVGTWNRPVVAARAAQHTDGIAMSRRRARGASTTTVDRARPARPASCSCAARTRASASSPIPSAPPRRSTPTAGCASGDLVTIDADGYAHRGRSQEGDHHPRRDEHRAARDRGAARRLPRGGACGGRRRCPTTGSVSGRARASCCTRAPPSTSRPPWSRAASRGARHVQAARAARGPRRAAGNRVGQDPEARDRRRILDGVHAGPP